MPRSRTFFKLANDLIDDEILFQLRHAALKTFLFLARCADHQTGQAFPGHRTIAASTHQTERSVRRAMGQLKKLGLVRIVAEAIKGLATAVVEVHNCRRPTAAEGAVPREVQMSFVWPDADPRVRQEGGHADPRVLYNKTQVSNKTTAEPADAPTTAIAAVVSQTGMLLLRATRLVEKWGPAHVQEKLVLLKLSRTPVPRPAGWLTRACQEDWQDLPRTSPPQKPPPAAIRKGSNSSPELAGAIARPTVDLRYPINRPGASQGPQAKLTMDEFRRRHKGFFADS